MAASGLTDDEVRELKNLGLTTEDIDNLKTKFIAEDFGATKADFLATLAETRTTSAAMAGDLSALATALDGNIADLSAALGNGVTAPTANAGGPYTGTAGAAIALNGSASVTPSGTIIGYEWDLDGDGEFDDATGATPSFTPSQAFRGMIGLRVTNSYGRMAVSYAPLTVGEGNGRPQIASFSPADLSPDVLVGVNQTFSVTVSDPENAQVSVRWLRDGTQVGTGTSYFYFATAGGAGPHLLEAVITDSDPLGGEVHQRWIVNVLAADNDGDGWRANVDCNDNNPQVGFCEAVDIPTDPADILTVTSTGDEASCPNGPGGDGYTLRCAIIDANTAGAGKRINFNIPAADSGCAASGVCTIFPVDNLPKLTANSTIIDGYTQAGAQVNTAASEQGTNAVIHIRIDGALNTSLHVTERGGLTIGGANNLIRGLAITNFIYCNGIIVLGNGNTIAGNLIGVTPEGGAAGNGEAYGNMVIWDGNYNTIGGPNAADRNVVADGSMGIQIKPYDRTAIGNRILGNLVGMNLAGTAALGRLQQYGIAIGSDHNIVGGTTAGARNVVGNSIGGIIVGANNSGIVQDNRILGNYIGTNAAGTAAIPNWSGVVGSPAGNLISGNVISGNSQSGIAMTYTVGAAHDKIVGNIVGLNATGTAALPNVNYGMQFSSMIGLTIGGTTAADRNVISGNTLAGISFNSHYDNYGRTADNHIQGNYIGTNATGTAAIPNGQNGIELNGIGGTTIGGTAAGAGNLISGNTGAGVLITNYFQHSQPTGNVVQGNRIGVAADGITPLGNSTNGVLIDASGFNTVGGTTAAEGNLIANNGGAGVRLDGGADVQARIVGNRSVANGGLGIDLAQVGAVSCAEAGTSGPNGLLHCPVIRGVTAGLVSGTAPEGATIDVYLVGTAADPSGNGEALTYLGSAISHGCGNTWTLAGLNLPAGAVITATASMLDGDVRGTSEFAANVALGTTDPLFVPAVTPAASQQGTYGSPATLDLGSFAEGCPVGPWDVSVDWGDGSADTTFQATDPGALGTKAHTYATGGAKNVTVTVANTLGGSASASFQVEVATFVPGAPTNLVATPGSARASVTWAAPVSNGGGAIDWYDLSIAPTAGGTPQTQRVTNLANLAATFTGLTNGTEYTISITAHNSNGSGAAATTTVTPALSALAITNLSTTSVAEGSASFTLTVTGGVFTEDTIVRWNGAERTTTLVDATTLTAQITATDVANSGTASVAVYDAASDRTSNALAVTITNVAPTATFGAPASVTVGDAIHLALTGASDPSLGDVVAGFTYAFDCGTGGGYGAASAASTVNCTTNATGTRTVKGKIIDQDGGSTEYTATVEITALPAATIAVAPASGTYGGTTTLSATLTLAGQPLAGKSVAFTLDGTAVGSTTTGQDGVATLANVSLAGITAGGHPAGVAATFAGDGTAAATSNTAALTVAQASQTIAFAALADRQLSASPFTVGATATSGLTVGFAASGACTVAGTSVALTGLGTCTLTATQAGDANHSAAAPVARSFQVTADPPAQVNLILTVSDGSTVKLAPNTISTGGTYPFDPGATVTLTAQPGTGQTFVRWTVDGVNRGWAPTITLTMGAAHAVDASFAGTKTFTDVGNARDDYAAIVALASRGTIAGYGNGKYGPGDKVSRAQMAALIARATPADPAAAPTNGTLASGCVAGSWDCEDWGTDFVDRGGLVASLWRNVGALQHYGVASGYDGIHFGPNSDVTYAQTIAFITRAMVAKGYWRWQPSGPTPPAGVPSGHNRDVRTFLYYVGSLPDLPVGKGWNDGATRGWFARALWAALDSYWGVDGTLPDGQPAGGFVE
ncbi:MAG: fibronectin type III domain-containing protein [Thermomicrobiales bacterium]